MLFFDGKGGKVVLRDNELFAELIDNLNDDGFNSNAVAYLFVFFLFYMKLDLGATMKRLSLENRRTRSQFWASKALFWSIPSIIVRLGSNVLFLLLLGIKRDLLYLLWQEDRQGIYFYHCYLVLGLMGGLGANYQAVLVQEADLSRFHVSSLLLYDDSRGK